MSKNLPPTLDASAAARWANLTTAAADVESPWLHEEVGRRMAERLGWMRTQPVRWLDWAPLRGGRTAHALVRAQYPKAVCHVIEANPARTVLAAKALTPAWWRLDRRRKEAPLVLTPPKPGAAQLVWANMALHMAPDPLALLKSWQQWLAVDGFLMFSCLGPDTLQQLRDLYATLGWPAPSHQFTDMHDWGDMLVQAGFAEPVMDMERITLTYATPERLLADLRLLGRNLHVQRFPGLRGRAWSEALKAAMHQHMRPSEGQPLSLTFEVVYGHAFRPVPRTRIAGESHVSLTDMRQQVLTRLRVNEA